MANTFIVNTAGDPGPMGTLSLRQAVAAANASAGNTVQFAPALTGSTITLAGTQISISKAMTISGPGASLITISGNNASRIFYISPEPDDSDPTHMQVTISGVTLANGRANFPTQSGGAIFAFHTQLSLTQSTISGSKATSGVGGGIYALLGITQVQHSRLIGNQALDGGGLFSAADLLVKVDYDTISGNSATEKGGGVYIEGTVSAVVNASTISGNMVLPPDIDTGPQGGGGIVFTNIDVGAATYIIASTITQNYSPSGGAGVALLDGGSATTIKFSTIVGNSAAVDETGIGITAAGGTVELDETIVANNFSQSGADDLAGSFLSTQSLIESPGGATITGSGSVIGLDPLLGPLADNGGETLTMLPAIGSPAIHQATCAACSILSIPDQRNATRHSLTDIGAVERQYPEDLMFRNGFEPP